MRVFVYRCSYKKLIKLNLFFVSQRNGLKTEKIDKQVCSAYTLMILTHNYIIIISFKVAYAKLSRNLTVSHLRFIMEEWYI